MEKSVLTKINDADYQQLIMRKFYLTFQKSETVSHQLTWSNYFELLKYDT